MHGELFVGDIVCFFAETMDSSQLFGLVASPPFHAGPHMEMQDLVWLPETDYNFLQHQPLMLQAAKDAGSSNDIVFLPIGSHIDLSHLIFLQVVTDTEAPLFLVPRPSVLGLPAQQPATSWAPDGASAAQCMFVGDPHQLPCYSAGLRLTPVKDSVLLAGSLCVISSRYGYLRIVPSSRQRDAPFILLSGCTDSDIRFFFRKYAASYMPLPSGSCAYTQAKQTSSMPLWCSVAGCHTRGGQRIYFDAEMCDRDTQADRQELGPAPEGAPRVTRQSET
jgi:hypothetical protein